MRGCNRVEIVEGMKQRKVEAPMPVAGRTMAIGYEYVIVRVADHKGVKECSYPRQCSWIAIPGSNSEVGHKFSSAASCSEPRKFGGDSSNLSRKTTIKQFNYKEGCATATGCYSGLYMSFIFRATFGLEITIR